MPECEWGAREDLSLCVFHFLSEALYLCAVVSFAPCDSACISICVCVQEGGGSGVRMKRKDGYKQLTRH